MTIDNFSRYQYTDLSTDDILICALGYETRSHYLLQKNLDTRNSTNTLVINFSDLDKSGVPEELLNKIESCMLKTQVCSYSQGEKFQNFVKFTQKQPLFNGLTRRMFVRIIQSVAENPFIRTEYFLRRKQEKQVPFRRGETKGRI